MRDSWVAVGIVLLLAGIILQAGAPIGVGVLILLTGGVAHLWSRLALEQVSYRRQIVNRRAFVGESIEVAFTLINRKVLPVPWIEVRDTVPERLPPEGVHVAPAPTAEMLFFSRSTSLASYERVTWRHQFHCTARGFYQIGPSALRSGDVFGLFPRSEDNEQIDHLTVLPRLLDLRDIGLPVERPFGEARGGSRIFEDQSRIVGVRDYRSGDPLKRIDWKATARRQHLQSRLYDPSSTINLLVALNAGTLEHPWEGYDPLLLERAISVAGSVAQFADEKRYAVGLAANCTFPNADRHIWVPPGRDPDQLTRILESLAMVTPFVLAPIEEIMQGSRRRLPLGASIVIVAGHLSEGMQAYLSRRSQGLKNLSVIWVGDQPAPALANKVEVYDAGPHLREFERRWQSEHNAKDPIGAWASAPLE